jgi:hypothetical protein
MPLHITQELLELRNARLHERPDAQGVACGAGHGLEVAQDGGTEHVRCLGALQECELAPQRRGQAVHVQAVHVQRGCEDVSHAVVVAVSGLEHAQAVHDVGGQSYFVDDDMHPPLRVVSGFVVCLQRAELLEGAVELVCAVAT